MVLLETSSGSSIDLTLKSSAISIFGIVGLAMEISVKYGLLISLEFSSTRTQSWSTKGEQSMKLKISSVDLIGLIWLSSWCSMHGLVFSCPCSCKVLFRKSYNTQLILLVHSRIQSISFLFFSSIRVSLLNQILYYFTLNSTYIMLRNNISNCPI